MDAHVHLVGNGSDFPFPVQGFWAWIRGLIPFRDYLRCRNIRDVIERDYQLKRAMGFDESHFSRITSLLRTPN